MFNYVLGFFKLVCSRRNWKVRAEVGKLGVKLESTTEIEKFKLNLERINEVGKLHVFHFLRLDKYLYFTS